MKAQAGTAVGTEHYQQTETKRREHVLSNDTEGGNDYGWPNLGSI
jgi:hypothetical protein